MVFRIFYRIIYGFIANERIVERLSESYAIRRAAQLAARLMIRSKTAIQDNVKPTAQEFMRDMNTKTGSDRLSSFTERLREEFRKGMHEMKDEMKRRNR